MIGAGTMEHELKGYEFWLTGEWRWLNKDSCPDIHTSHPCVATALSLWAHTISGAAATGKALVGAGRWREKCVASGKMLSCISSIGPRSRVVFIGS